MGNSTSEIVSRACEASFTERLKSLNQDIELLHDTSVVFSSAKLSIRSDLGKYKVGPEAAKAKAASSDLSEESLLFSQYDSFAARDRNEAAVKSLIQSISQTTEVDLASTEITKRLQAFCRVFEAILRVDDLKNKKSSDNLGPTSELPTAAKAAIKFGLSTLLNLIECVAGVNPMLFEFILNDANLALSDSVPLSLATSDSTLIESFEKISDFFDAVVCGKIRSLSEAGSLVSLLPLFKLALSSGSISSFMMFGRRLIHMKELSKELKNLLFPLLKSFDSVPLMHSLFKWGSKVKGDALEIKEEKVKGAIDNEDGVVYLESVIENISVYVEILVVQTNENCHFGVAAAEFNEKSAWSNSSYTTFAFGSNSSVYSKSDESFKMTPWAAGDKIGVFVDSSAKTVTFFKNGEKQPNPPLKFTQEKYKIYLHINKDNEFALNKHLEYPEEIASNFLITKPSTSAFENLLKAESPSDEYLEKPVGETVSFILKKLSDGLLYVEYLFQSRNYKFQSKTPSYSFQLTKKSFKSIQELQQDLYDLHFSSETSVISEASLVSAISSLHRLVMFSILLAEQTEDESLEEETKKKILNQTVAFIQNSKNAELTDEAMKVLSSCFEIFYKDPSVKLTYINEALERDEKKHELQVFEELEAKIFSNIARADKLFPILKYINDDHIAQVKRFYRNLIQKAYKVTCAIVRGENVKVSALKLLSSAQAALFSQAGKEKFEEKHLEVISDYTSNFLETALNTLKESQDLLRLKPSDEVIQKLVNSLVGTILDELLNALVLSPLTSKMISEVLPAISDISALFSGIPAGKTILAGGVGSVEEVYESSHNYPDSANLKHSITVPGAIKYTLSFDPQCKTENGCDYLELWLDEAATNKFARWEGESFPKEPVEVLNPSLHFTFHSDGSVNYWGWKITIKALIETTFYKKQWPETSKDSIEFFFSRCAFKMVRGDLEEIKTDPEVQKALNNPLLSYGISDHSLVYVQSLPKIEDSIQKLSLQILRPAKYLVSPSLQKFSFLPNYEIGLKEYLDYYHSDHPKVFSSNHFFNDFVEGTEDLLAAWTALRKKSGITGNHLNIGGNDLDQAERAIFAVYSSFFEIGETVKGILTSSFEAGATVKSFVKEACNIRYWAQKQKQKLFDAGKTEVTYKGISDDIVKKCAILIGADYKSSLNHIGISKVMKNLVQNIAKGQRSHLKLASKWKNVKDALKSAKKLTSLVSIKNKSTKAENDDLKEFSRVAELVKSFLENPAPVEQLVEALNKRRSRAIVRALGFLSISKLISYSSSEHETFIVKSFSESLTVEGEKLDYSDSISGVDPLLSKSVQTGFFLVIRSIQEDLISSSFCTFNYELFSHFITAIEALTWKYRGEDLHLFMSQPLTALLKTLLKWAKGDFQQEQLQGKFLVEKCVTRIGLLTEEAVPEGKTKILLEKVEGQPTTFLVLDFGGSELPITQFVITDEIREDLEEAVPEFQLGGIAKRVYVYRNEADPTKEYLTGINEDLTPKFEKYQTLLGQPDVEEIKRLAKNKENLMRNSWKLFKQMFYTLAGSWKGNHESNHLNVQDMFLKVLFSEMRSSFDLKEGNLDDFNVDELASGAVWINKGRILREFPKSEMEVWMESFANDSQIELAELLNTYRSYIDPLVIGSVSKPENELLAEQSNLYKGEDGKIQFTQFLSLVKETFTQDESLEAIKNSEENKNIWKEHKNPEKIIDYNDFQAILKDLQDHYIPSSENLFEKYLDLFKNHGILVSAEHLKGEFPAELLLESGELGFYQLLTRLKTNSKFSNIFSEISSFYLNHPDLPESSKQVDENQKATNDYITALLLVIYGGFTSSYLCKSLSGAEYVKVLLSYLHNSKSIQISTLSSRILAKVLPSQHSPATLETIWKDLHSNHENLAQFLLNSIGKSMTEDQRSSYEARNLLLSLVQESRWADHVYFEIQKAQVSSIEALNAGNLLDCVQIGSILVMTSNFAIGRKPFTLSVVSLKDSPFSWGIVKNVDAEGKFSVYSLIDDNSVKVEASKILSIENAVKGNLFSSLQEKGPGIVDHLFSIWTALNDSFNKPLKTQGEGFVIFSVVYKCLQNVIVTAFKDAFEIFEINPEKISKVLADLIELKSFRDSFTNSDFIAAKNMARDKVKALMENEKGMSIEEVNEQANLLDEDSKKAFNELQENGVSPLFALKCVKSGIKQIELVGNYSESVQSSLLYKLSLIDEAGITVEDPDGQAEIFQNNFYHLIISDSHNSFKSLEFDLSSRIFDILKTFTDEVTIRLGIECTSIDGNLASGIKIGSLDLPFTISSFIGDQPTILRITANSNGEVNITNESNSEVSRHFNRSVFTGFSIGKIQLYLSEGSLISLVMLEVHNKAINSNFQGKLEKAIKSDMTERFVKIRSRAPDSFSSRLNILGISPEQVELCKAKTGSISEAVHFSLENFSPASSLKLSETGCITELKIFDTVELVPPDFEIVKVFENFNECDFLVPGRKILAFKKGSNENSVLSVSIGEAPGLETLGELTPSGDARVVSIYSKVGKATQKEPGINSIIFIKCASVNNVPVPRNFSVLTDKEGKAINIAGKSEKPYYLFIALNKTFEYLGIPVSRLESILPKFTTFGLTESVKSSVSDKKEKPADFSSYSLTSLYSLLFAFEHNILVRQSESLLSTSLQKSHIYFESLLKLVPISKLFLYLDSPFVKSLSLSNESLIKSLAFESISALVCTLVPKSSSGRVLKSVQIESTHPYDNNMDVDDVISIPGASGLRVEFDPQCYTESGCDPLRFYENTGRTGEIRCFSGQGESVWTAFEVPGDTVYTYFHSDGSVNYWGYKFEVIPVGTSGVVQKTNSAVALEILAKIANDEKISGLVDSDQFLFPLFAYLMGSSNIEEKLMVLDMFKVSARRLTSSTGKEIIRCLGESAEALYKTTSNDKTSHNVLQALIQVLFECKKAGIQVIKANWFQDLADLLSDMHGLGEKESTLDMYLFDIFKGASAVKLELNFESEHPYQVKTFSKEISVDGASSLALEFSKDSKAEKNHTAFFSRDSQKPVNVLTEANTVNVKGKFEFKGPDIELSNDGLRVTRTSSNGWGAALLGVKLSSGCTSFTYFIENDGASDYLYIGFVEAEEHSAVELNACFNSDLGKKLFTWKKNGDMHRHLSNNNVSAFGTGDTIKMTVNFEQSNIICYKNGVEVYNFNDITGPLIPLLSFGGSNQFVQLKSIETANETSIESKRVNISGDTVHIWFPVNAGYFNIYNWDLSTDEKTSISKDNLTATNLTEESSFLPTNLKLEGGQHYFEVQSKKGIDFGVGVCPSSHLESKSWDHESVSIFWADSPSLSIQEKESIGLLLDLDLNKLTLFKNREAVTSITEKTFEGIFSFFAVLKSKDSEVTIKNEEPTWLDILSLDSDRVSADFGYKVKVSPVFKGRGQGAMDNFLKSSSQEFRDSWNTYKSSLTGFFRSGAVEELVMFIDQFSASKGKDPTTLTQEDLTLKKTDLVYYPELEKVEEGNVFKLYQILQDFNKRVQNSLFLFDLNFKAQLTDLQRFLIGSRSFVFFDIKNKLLKAVLDKTKNDARTEINIDRPKAARHRNKKEVDREGLFSIFGQIFRAMSAVGNTSLRNSERIYKVNYRGEGSIDAGGPYNESMSNMCDELMSSFLRLLVPTSNNTNNMGEYRDAWIINPSAKSQTELEMFKFLGKLMGAAIRTQNNLNLSLPPIFWKSLLRERLTVKDLKTMDLCTVTILEILKNPESNELTSENFSMVYDEKFTTKNSAGEEVEVVPGGKEIQVTFENSKEFSALALENRLNESNKIYEVIREGLSAVVPVDYLNLMSYKQFETLVCGAPDVDIDILKENTDYEGCAVSDQHIVYFWEVLKAFAPRERTLFLKFVWGRTKLPSGKDWRHMKVTRLNPSGPVNNYMPISHTCFFTLDLPAYTTKEAMEQKLLYAITHCTAIDLDGRAGDGWEDND